MRKPWAAATIFTVAAIALSSCDGTNTYYSGSSGGGTVQCAESAILSGVVTGAGTSKFKASAGTAAKLCTDVG